MIRQDHPLRHFPQSFFDYSQLKGKTLLLEKCAQPYIHLFPHEETKAKRILRLKPQLGKNPSWLKILSHEKRHIAI